MGTPVLALLSKIRRECGIATIQVSIIWHMPVQAARWTRRRIITVRLLRRSWLFPVRLMGREVSVEPPATFSSHPWISRLTQSRTRTHPDTRRPLEYGSRQQPPEYSWMRPKDEVRSGAV